MLDSYVITILTIMAIWSIVALGLNVMTGWAGQLNIGMGVYMGTGAYASAMLTTLTLFIRGARGVTLTTPGTVMLDHVRRCMAGLEQMHSALLPYTQGLTTHLTLFANNNAINSFLPQDLALFFAAQPTVRITLEERMGHEIVAAVAIGRADVGVVAIDIDHPELDFIPYQEDQFVLIVPPAHRFAAQRSVRYADCLGETWICLQSGAPAIR